MFWFATVLVLGILSIALLLRWSSNWGASIQERSATLPGDDFLDDQTAVRVVMTRAVTLPAPPGDVWPWVAQIGRGAGWYSYDWLDNGRKRSARHPVSWIPDARLGDATAIGYLRHLAPGESVAWWVGGLGFAGAWTRLVVSFQLRPHGRGTRLVSRNSADGTGFLARPALLVFRILDSIMAIRQLVGLRDRVVAATRTNVVPDPETGAVDQYQLYHVLYADGNSAGVAGKEHCARWRQAAVNDGVLPAPFKPINTDERHDR